MPDDELTLALRGVGVTPATPFTGGGERVEVKGLADNIEFLVESGVRLLYPCGHTGEFSSLSLEEWTAVVEAVVEAANGRAAVVPGVGQGLSVAREMLSRGDRIGVDGFLFIPPHQVHLADGGIREYWKALLGWSPAPVVLYKREWPGDAVLLELCADPRVLGVKYGGRDPAVFAETARAGRDVVFTCGTAELYAPFFALAGSRGFTSGLANFAPSLALRLFDALNGGAFDRAMELRARAVPFERLRARDGDANNVPAVKRAMEVRGLAGGPVRPPLRNLDAETASEVDRTAGDLLEFVEMAREGDRAG